MLTVLILILINISFVGVGLPNSLLGSAWPSMHGEIGVPVSYVGIISMIYLGGTVVASFFSGKLLARFTAGICTFMNVSMIGLSLIGFSLSSSFIFLCVFALPLGIGTGFTDAVLNSYSAMHFGAKHMNWHHCFWGVGATIGPVFMSYGIASSSWRVGYQITGVVVVAIAVALLFSLPLWKKFAKLSDTSTEEANKPQSFGSLFRLPGFKTSLAIFFVYVSAEATVGLWGSSYLVMSRGIAPELAAGWLSLYFLGMTLGRFISGFVAMLLTGRQIIWLGCVLFGCGIVFLQIPVGNAAYLIGFFLMGLGCAPIFPTLVHSSPTRFGARYAQTAIGVQISSANIGATVTPPLFGLLAARVGHGLFPVFLGFLLAVMALMIGMLNKTKVDEETGV
ncbi:MAG: MFS transporter [Oscillospiraceae bacterium]|nr:MFS transporter [Oscillospiraceae bacterium]